MAVTQTITVEKLCAMPDILGTRYKLVCGEVIEALTAGPAHTLIAFLVARLLEAFVSARGLGLVFGNNTSYLLSRDPDTVRVPDVSFVLWERVPQEGVPARYWTVAPDIAVEIVSPFDRATDVQEKAIAYIATGTRCVWVLWPELRAVRIYTERDTVRELGLDDALDGGDVLPGFQVHVAELFNIRTKR